MSCEDSTSSLWTNEKEIKIMKNTEDTPEDFSETADTPEGGSECVDTPEGGSTSDEMEIQENGLEFGKKVEFFYISNFKSI